MTPDVTAGPRPLLRRSDKYRGLWVALDERRYDPKTAKPVAGSVVAPPPGGRH